MEREAQQKLQQIECAAGPQRPRGRPRKEQGQPPESERERRKRQKANKQLQRARKQAAAPTRQYNLVDPDSRVMHDNGRKCFIQGYNAQIAVDSHAQVIIAAELTQETNDRQQLVAMARAVRIMVRCKPNTLLADAGYWDTESLHDPELKNIEVLVAPDSKLQPADAPLPARAPNNEEAIWMREVLTSPAGRKLYGLRKETVEPVFGQIKEVRGIRRFRLRGLVRSSHEWQLICATHDLLKLYRHRTGQWTPKPRKRRGHASPRVLGAGCAVHMPWQRRSLGRVTRWYRKSPPCRPCKKNFTPTGC